MELHQFSESAPAASISSKMLDQNFRKLRPLRVDGNAARQYLLTETPDGWRLQIFPTFPEAGSLHLLGIKDGAMGWFSTTECEA